MNYTYKKRAMTWTSILLAVLLLWADASYLAASAVEAIQEQQTLRNVIGADLSAYAGKNLPVSALEQPYELSVDIQRIDEAFVTDRFIVVYKDGTTQSTQQLESQLSSFGELEAVAEQNLSSAAILTVEESLHIITRMN